MPNTPLLKLCELALVGIALILTAALAESYHSDVATLVELGLILFIVVELYAYLTCKGLRLGDSALAVRGHNKRAYGRSSLMCLLVYLVLVA